MFSFSIKVNASSILLTPNCSPAGPITRTSFAFAGRNGYIMEEFIYDRDVLTEIKISRKNANLDGKTEVHRFFYENQALIKIERICQNGYKELLYTTKKPNFNKIKEDTYNSLKHLITAYKGDFASFGIEGFLDQPHPMLCVCFTTESSPSDLIADWNVQMYDVWMYDWLLNDTQEKKCAKIIAEIVVKLVEDESPPRFGEARCRVWQQSEHVGRYR